MEVFRPSICGEFRCSAGGCGYNCCQGWGIPLTADDRDRVHASGAGRDAATVSARNGVYAATMALASNACPFLNPEGLCNLQVESGKQHLPEICSSFPLLRFRVWETEEMACSPGCEEIGRLLLHLKEGISFENLPVERPLGPTYAFDLAAAEPDRPLLRYYWDIKGLCVSILLERSYAMDTRMYFVKEALLRLHQLEAEGRLDEFPAFLEAFPQEVDPDAFESMQTMPDYLSILHMAYACRLPDTQRPWQPAILERLGIDADTGAVDWERYLAAVAYRDTILERHGFLLENFTVCFFHMLGLPFGESNASLWDNCLWFCSLYANFKLFLAGALYPGISEDAFLRAAAAFSRGFVHGDMRRSKVLESLRVLEMATPAALDLLLRQ